MEMFRCWVWDGSCKGGGGGDLCGKKEYYGGVELWVGEGWRRFGKRKTRQSQNK